MLNKITKGIIFSVFISFNQTYAEDKVEVKIIAEYLETMHGVSRKTRLLLDNQVVRVDVGQDYGDYILYDVGADKISHVLPAEKTVYLYEHKNAKPQPKPENIKITTKTVDISDRIPDFNGLKPLQIITSVNGIMCEKSIVVQGIDDKLLNALRNFNHALADYYFNKTSAPTTNTNHAEICNKAMTVYNVNHNIKFGLPIKTNRVNGWKRTITAYYTAMEIPADMFSYPRGYQEIVQY